MKKYINIITIAIIMFFIFEIKSYAAMEIKSGTESHKNISASDAFLYCYNLRASSSTLGANTLDPHLSTARDWGAVVYLAMSNYGANGNNDAINGFMTTGNNSGVMDFGKTTYTFVSMCSSNSDGGSYSSGAKVLVNRKNTKYVDNVTGGYANSIGMAYKEILEWGQNGTFTDKYNYSAMSLRKGVYGFNWTDGSNTRWAGVADGSTTFRPAIWN